jgi:hypothetical protein
MALSLFPDGMFQKQEEELTLETIAGKFSYFFEQIHLTHLQTPSHAEHSALNVWKEVVEAKDEFLEKIMGYLGRKVKAYKMPEDLKDYTPSYPTEIITKLKDFAKDLERFGRMNSMPDIENLAQSLSGTAAQTLYLLTQS